MSSFNELGHKTIHRVNDFTHQLFGTVCDVIDHIVPQTNLLDQEDDDIVRRYIQCDVNQHLSNLKIVAYIPGVKKEDINVSIESNVLTINALSSHYDSNFNYIKNRRYSRSFNVPNNTTKENVNISYLDGILKIMVNNFEPSHTNATILTVN